MTATRPRVLLGLLTAGLFLLAPALARADSSSSLTVVGTSDVSDSGLVPNLIMPQFEKAYSQFSFSYKGSATGLAIQNAESGTGGPSVLIVHAPSLENQFVAGGYSYKHQYGYALFTNDFVLAGPTGDPAGAATNAANSIAQAFADVAAAGAAGKATFFTRGGTSTASGTTVEEHSIWGLVHSSGLQPASLSLCVVSAADGGGMSPVKSAALNGQPCPDSGTVNSPDNPSWYFINAGSTQGANVLAANACPPADAPSGTNTCYVLTDRGTFDYLASGTDPAGSIPSLKIVTRGPQSASAPGGAHALTNYFHAYIINPAKPGETVNLTAAQDFIDFLTSPALQSQLKGYLAKTSDPAGPPFAADASPILTASGFPHAYRASRPATVTGSLTNAEPGYPPLAGKTVTVDEVKGALDIPVATGVTNASGDYRISFTPPASGAYEVTTSQISQIENSTLSPKYGDILSPAATAAVGLTVHSAIANLKVSAQGGRALITGTVAPGTLHHRATVSVLARVAGRNGAFRNLATLHLASTQGNFAVAVPLAAGTWQVMVSFHDPGQVVAASSRRVRVKLGARPTASVALHRARVRNGTWTIAGALSPAAASGARLVLLGQNTTPGASSAFRVLGRATLRSGKTTFTLRAKARRGIRWVLQLEYILPGQAPSFSGLRTVDVP